VVLTTSGVYGGFAKHAKDNFVRLRVRHGQEISALFVFIVDCDRFHRMGGVSKKVRELRKLSNFKRYL